jgi:hypothetical protein
MAMNNFQRGIVPGVGFGLALGIGIGAALGQIGVWLPIGMALGGGLGMLLSRRAGGSHEK